MTDQPFSLLRNLAKEQPNTSATKYGKLNFVDALQQMGVHSVFDIVRRSKSAFVRELYQLSDADGERAYENARCYATQIVRLYRNQLISSGRMQNATRRTGIRSLVDIGPSFPNLFKENWDQFCKVGAIEAKDSPVAYLSSLYRFALEELEGSTSEAYRISLNVRRPDLKDLLIDQQSTFTPIPTLQIVNEVLGSGIRAYVDTVPGDKDKTIYQLIAERQHPFLFPYNFHHHQVSLGLSNKKPWLGELSYRVSLKVPATLKSNDYGGVQQSSATAQMIMSGLSPQQQALMLELPVPDSDPSLISLFFRSKYGSDYIDGAANPLDLVKLFVEKTGLSAQQVETLLAIRNDVPYSSPNALPAVSDPALSSAYGAMYVNGPAADPMDMAVDNKHEARLTHTSLDRYDRLHRIIRLQRWSAIPFAELDTLVMSVIRSVHTVATDKVMDGNTLRALGTYRYLHKHYGLEPEEFAALIDNLAAYANGARLPLFDKVFNNPMLFDTPLVLDDSPVAPGEPSAAKAIAQLSAGLRVPEESLWLLIEESAAQLGTPFKLDLKMTSALYRQARIASLFGLTTKDSRALADLLGGTDYRKTIVTGALRPLPEPAPVTGGTDILDLLMQLDWASAWLKDTDRDVHTLRRQLGLDLGETDTSQDALDQLNQLARDARQAVLTEEKLATLNLPEADKNDASIQWWATVLAPLKDVHGLVASKEWPLLIIYDPATKLQQLIEGQLESIDFSDDIDSAAVATKLLEFFLNGYLAQHRLVEGLLQSLAGLPLNRCEEVVRWVGNSVDEFLAKLLEATLEADLAPPLTDAGKAVTDTLAKYLRYGELTLELGLSAQALRSFLVNAKWLQTTFDGNLRLSLASFYQLDRYSHWRDSAEQPEELLLDYFTLANITELPTDHNKLCAASLARLTGWSATEIEVAIAAFPVDDIPVAKSMQQVDWILRMHSVSQQTGLSASAILQATNLTRDSSAAEWQAVGEAAMAASR